MAVNIGSLIASLILDTEGFRRGADDAISDTDKLTGAFDKVAKGT